MAALFLLIAGAVALSTRSAAAAEVYNKELTLDKRAGGCSCSCSYLGGMCRAGAADDPCCQDVCCGADAEFPTIVEGRRPDAAAPGVAPIRGMLQPTGSQPKMDIGSEQGPEVGNNLYNHPLTMQRRRDGCECECSYVGGMCRAGTGLACCQEVCCGADVGFPSAHEAPLRGMLQGAVAEPDLGPLNGLKTEDSTETMEEAFVDKSASVGPRLGARSTPLAPA
eukprot:CAMPEP_0176201396 /NCGR_PEP_ID=MMETSP0121_2-20121125/9544_1 /TAXON_ID=160619 /ORGANISM="Kryptoperidinium foliaceum, Strain CCMP 1326" /LENGTH=222 /DNA_ID=CAMNT_0017540271 /DNA_START=82 /DNA_END=746 /DNA_ORIENTATION=+